MTSYRCYLCAAILFDFTEFKSHIYRHHWLCELSLPLLCCQEGCKASYSKPYNLFRHILTHHNRDKTRAGSAADSILGSHFSSLTESDDGNNVAESLPAKSKSKCNAATSVELEGVTLVAALRANSSIPYSIIPPVIGSVNSIASSVIAMCKSEAASCLESCGSEVSVELVNQFSPKFEQRVNKLKQPFQFLDSKYKQDMYFAKHQLFVAPQAINFGLRIDTNCAKSKLVYDTFQYVSVQQTVVSLLHNQDYAKGLLHSMKRETSPIVIEHHSDGQKFSTNPLFSSSDKLSLVIQLFYDGMGTTNPLRANSVLCNMGVFYYVIKKPSRCLEHLFQ